MVTSSVWQNRIMGYGTEAPDQLVANPRNWRLHPKHQQDALRGALETLGWIQNVIVNHRTGFVIDGHARVTLAMRDNQAEIPITYVDLSEDEEALALATLDPIAALAVADMGQLDGLLREITTDNAGLQALLDDLAVGYGIKHVEDDAGATSAEHDNSYSRVVESPVYGITGDCPVVSELVDETRASALLAQIDAADAPDDVKQFLRHAAARHLKFDYAAIAEFYAHANAEIQDMMEQSALVIIDVDRAIELGFAKLAGELRDVRIGDDDG